MTGLYVVKLVFGGLAGQGCDPNEGYASFENPVGVGTVRRIRRLRPKAFEWDQIRIDRIMLGSALVFLTDGRPEGRLLFADLERVPLRVRVPTACRLVIDCTRYPQAPSGSWTLSLLFTVDWRRPRRVLSTEKST